MAPLFKTGFPQAVSVSLRNSLPLHYYIAINPEFPLEPQKRKYNYILT